VSIWSNVIENSTNCNDKVPQKCLAYPIVSLLYRGGWASYGHGANIDRMVWTAV
jgi:hypothetical protein